MTQNYKYFKDFRYFFYKKINHIYANSQYVKLPNILARTVAKNILMTFQRNTLDVLLFNLAKVLLKPLAVALTNF